MRTATVDHEVKGRLKERKQGKSESRLKLTVKQRIDPRKSARNKVRLESKVNH